MAKILVFDDRLGGSPPWKYASSTCLVNETHSMVSIVTWLKGKCKKYAGKETVYVMAHGNQGSVQLGRDGLNVHTAHFWGSLAWKLDQIIILACSVAGGEKGDDFCSKLARTTHCFVTAAETKQMYFYLPFGLLPTSFGDWEGRVDTWDPEGNWFSSFGVEEGDLDYGNFSM